MEVLVTQHIPSIGEVLVTFLDLSDQRSAISTPHPYMVIIGVHSIAISLLRVDNRYTKYKKLKLNEK